MIGNVLKRALSVLMKKPFKLWGISLLYLFFCGLVSVLFGIIPGLAIAIILLLSTSMTMVFLHGLHGDDVQVVQLFDCFKDWKTIKRVVCGMAWMTLWISLWALIPIVGFVFAIMKTYAYRLTPYILVHEPDVDITNAIKISEQRTNGYKGKMFLADIIPIALIFAVFFILGAFAAIPYIGILFGIVLGVFYIAVVALYSLYMGLIQAAFYDEINADIAKRNAAPSYYQPPVQSNYVPRMMFCTQCGTQYDANASDCPNCHHHIN